MQNKRILLKGNEAIAKGAIDAGLEAYFGYPITPQSELIEYMAREMTRLGRIFIQAESEIAAINMVFGASSAGASVMTSSSSPGISLKQEGISYLAACELPAVIVNVMRGGPGLGNIAPSQSDYFQAVKGGGHGDYHNIVLAPNSVSEMYSIMLDAFNLAFKWKNPVMVLADGMLGQMIENVYIPQKTKIFKKGDLSWTVGKNSNNKQKIIHSLFLEPEKLEKVNLNLQKKYKQIKGQEQRYEEYKMNNATIAIIAYGLCSRIGKGIIEKLRKKNIKIGLIRPITLWPFPLDTISKYLKKLKEIWVIELSSGQMVEDVKLAANGKIKVRFFGKLGGVVPTEKEIINFFNSTKKDSNV